MDPPLTNSRASRLLFAAPQVVSASKIFKSSLTSILGTPSKQTLTCANVSD